ncbi:uncharacterized protein PRCAT00004316001 [Priceomyces carsonii]|uniref:uncharacterized protein n=1 Tax=Priceomyces carsonii TaxID=28549 RepID=UPI002ED91693|nr:unnamed protein product [Priceomyces carsonii]
MFYCISSCLYMFLIKHEDVKKLNKEGNIVKLLQPSMTIDCDCLRELEDVDGGKTKKILIQIWIINFWDIKLGLD